MSEVWQVETEIRGVPARPPAPRNYIVDMRRGGRNNRELVAETTYKPTPKFTEATRVTLPAPRSDRVVEERISTVRTETSVESVPNNYFDSRPPPPRDERPPSREERPPLPSYRDVPRREDRPPPPNYRDAPRSRDDYRQPPGYPEPYRGYQRDPERGYQREPEIARGYSRDPEPPRGYYDPPRTTSYQTSYRTEAREESYRDRPIDRYDEKPSRPPAPAPKRLVLYFVTVSIFMAACAVSFCVHVSILRI